MLWTGYFIPCSFPETHQYWFRDTAHELIILNSSGYQFPIHLSARSTWTLHDSLVSYQYPPVRMLLLHFDRACSFKFAPFSYWQPPFPSGVETRLDTSGLKWGFGDRKRGGGVHIRDRIPVTDMRLPLILLALVRVTPFWKLALIISRIHSLILRNVRNRVSILCKAFSNKDYFDIDFFQIQSVRSQSQIDNEVIGEPQVSSIFIEAQRLQHNFFSLFFNFPHYSNDDDDNPYFCFVNHSSWIISNLR